MFNIISDVALTEFMHLKIIIIINNPHHLNIFQICSAPQGKMLSLHLNYT